MSTAVITKNEIPVQSCTFRPELQSWFLVIDCPAGWDDVKRICKKVLKYVTVDGEKPVTFTFTGWNSDRNDATFRSGTRTASF